MLTELERNKSPYPEHWWAYLSPENKPDWEILPHEADKSKNEVILSKRNELGLLSNFAATPIQFRGLLYASLESFWHSLKFPENQSERNWEMSREQIMRLSGREAQRAGVVASENMAALGINWVTFEGEKIFYKGIDQQKHLSLIEQVTRAKIDQNPEVKKVLLATGDLILKPDHPQNPTDPAAWRYYEIYMRLRAELFANPTRSLSEKN